MLGYRFRECLASKAFPRDSRKLFCLEDFFGVTSLPFTHTIYTLITHKCKRGHSKRKTLDRFSTTHIHLFERESHSSLVRNHCSIFSFPLPLSYLERRFVPKHNPHIFNVVNVFGVAGKHWKKPRMADATWSLLRDLEN